MEYSHRLAQEVTTAANDGEERIHIRDAALVRVTSDAIENWTAVIRNHRTPWPIEQTKIAVVEIPDRLKQRDKNAYYHLLDCVSFQQVVGVPSQMVLSSTLATDRSRDQIRKNILMQMLV